MVQERMKFILFTGLFFFLNWASYVHADTSSARTENANTPNSEDKALAKQSFSAGLELLKKANFQGAAKEFERSISIYPTKSGLFNLANCYFETSRYIEAMGAIGQLKEKFGSDLDDDWLSDISVFEQKIDEFVLKLSLEVNIDGAEVVIDGGTATVTPINTPIVLGVGEHEISVSRKGYESEIVNIGADMAGEQHLNLTLSKVTEQEETLSTAEPIDEGEEVPFGERKRVWTWVAYGIGGATGIAAIVTGTKAISLNRDLRDNCDNNVCPSDQESNVDTAHSLGVATGVLIGVTAVSVVAGTILLFVEGKKKKDRVAVLPQWGPDGAGVTFATSF